MNMCWQILLTFFMLAFCSAAVWLNLFCRKEIIMRLFTIEYTDNAKLDCFALLRISLFRHSSVLGFSAKLPIEAGKQKITICLRDSTTVTDAKQPGQTYDELPYIRESLRVFIKTYPESTIMEKVWDEYGIKAFLYL